MVDCDGYSIPSMDSALFGFHNHENNFGDALGLSYSVWTRVAESKDNELHAALKKYAIGWCAGERLCYKPLYALVGIMCEKDGERFWFHLQRMTLDTLFGLPKAPRRHVRSRHGQNDQNGHGGMA